MGYSQTAFLYFRDERVESDQNRLRNRRGGLQAFPNRGGHPARGLMHPLHRGVNIPPRRMWIVLYPQKLFKYIFGRYGFNIMQPFSKPDVVEHVSFHTMFPYITMHCWHSIS